MRTLALILALVAAPALADPPKMRCSTCSFLPNVTTIDGGLMGGVCTIRTNVDANWMYISCPTRFSNNVFMDGTLGALGTVTFSGQTLNLAHTGPILNASGATGKWLITSNISAANTNNSTAPVFELSPQNALDATDYILAVRNSAASDWLTVSQNGNVGMAGPRLDLRSAAWTNFSLGTTGNELFGVAVAAGVLNVSRTVGSATTSVAEVPGTLNVTTTGVGNLGASAPDDLQTYTLPASSLVQTGHCINVTAWGTTLNNANAKTVRLTIGPTPTALVTKQLTASIAGFWKIEAVICRTGASTQDYFAEAQNFGGTTVSSTDGATVLSLASVGTLTQTETNALVIKTQSTTTTTDNDIISEGLIVEYR